MTYSPTFPRTEFCRVWMDFSICFSLSSRDSILESIVVLKSIIFSIGFLISESFSETICSAISFIVSDETPWFW